jgi:hypothetical protein
MRLRLRRYAAFCLHTVSHLIIREDEERSNDLAPPARQVWYGPFAFYLCLAS